MFMGTLTRVDVYPREVLRAALLLNAAAVIVAHNHPSGSMAPSAGDDALTWSLRSCLQQLDVNLLDHLIVTGGGCYSYAAEARLAPGVPTRLPAAPKRARRAESVTKTSRAAQSTSQGSMAEEGRCGCSVQAAAALGVRDALTGVSAG